MLNNEMYDNIDANSSAFQEGARAYMAMVCDHVARFGWHLTGVFPCSDDDQQVVFAYTTGLVTTHNHPELIVIGPPPAIAERILADIVERIESGETFADGDLLTGGAHGGDVLRFRSMKATDSEYPLSVSQRFLGQVDFPVLVGHAAINW
jgi:hypothetical protein